MNRLQITVRTRERDVLAVNLARAGYAYSTISAETGLSKGQITRRLRWANLKASALRAAIT